MRTHNESDLKPESIDTHPAPMLSLRHLTPFPAARGEAGSTHSRSEAPEKEEEGVAPPPVAPPPAAPEPAEASAFATGPKRADASTAASASASLPGELEAAVAAAAAMGRSFAPSSPLAATSTTKAASGQRSRQAAPSTHPSASKSSSANAATEAGPGPRVRRLPPGVFVVGLLQTTVPSASALTSVSASASARASEAGQKSGAEQLRKRRRRIPIFQRVHGEKSISQAGGAPVGPLWKKKKGGDESDLREREEEKSESGRALEGGANGTSKNVDRENCGQGAEDALAAVSAGTPQSCLSGRPRGRPCRVPRRGENFRNGVESTTSTGASDRSHPPPSSRLPFRTRGTGDAIWLSRYRLLRRCWERTGHADTPSRSRGGGAGGELGIWAELQRRGRESGTLREDKVQALEALGFDWSLGGANDGAAAKRRRGEEEKREVPSLSSNKKPKKMGLKFGDIGVEWLSLTSSAGDVDSTPPEAFKSEKIAAGGAGSRVLDVVEAPAFPSKNSLHAGEKGESGRARRHSLSMKTPHWERRWTATLERLRAFKEEAGHCDVPQHYTKDKILGIWCKTQRSEKRKGLLSEERVCVLEDLGFVWITRGKPRKSMPEGSTKGQELLAMRKQTWGKIWEERFAELLKVREGHSNCNVRMSDVRATEDANGNSPMGKLYKWVRWLLYE